MRIAGLIAVVVSGVWSAGCITISNVQTADTLGRGNVQVGIEPGAWGVGGVKGTGFVPHADASVRYGVSDIVDLGLRVGFLFLELQGKVLLTDPNDRVKAISIAPTAAASAIAGALSGGAADLGLYNVALPVLVGLKFGNHELVLGPRVQCVFASVGRATTGSTTRAGGGVIGPGLSVGFAARLTERFGLMPEVGAFLPAYAFGASSGTTSGSSVDTALNAQGALLQFKLGFLIGGRPFRDSVLDEQLEREPVERPRLGAPPPPPPPPPPSPAPTQNQDSGAAPLSPPPPPPSL